MPTALVGLTDEQERCLALLDRKQDRTIPRNADSHGEHRAGQRSQHNQVPDLGMPTDDQTRRDRLGDALDEVAPTQHHARGSRSAIAPRQEHEHHRRHARRGKDPAEGRRGIVDVEDSERQRHARHRRADPVHDLTDEEVAESRCREWRQSTATHPQSEAASTPIHKSGGSRALPAQKIGDHPRNRTHVLVKQLRHKP